MPGVGLVATVDWKAAPGVVYLMRCCRTGEYKVGGTVDPGSRLRQLSSTARVRLGRELRFVWKVITNGVGRLESRWNRRWKKYRLPGGRREWFDLPDSEVALFRSFVCLVWKDCPPLSVRNRAALGAPPPGCVLPRAGDPEW